MSSKKVSAAFASMKAKLGEARPDQGQGLLGQWPAEGDHHCYVVRIEEDEAAKFFVGRSDQGMITELDAVSYRFWFQLTEDPENKDADGLSWGGALFVFPTDYAALKDSGKRQQVEISRNRLCGHLKTLLQKDVGTEGGLDPDAALEEVKALLAGETQVVAEVRCQYREGRKRRGAAADAPAPTYKTEFMLNLVSG